MSEDMIELTTEEVKNIERGMFAYIDLIKKNKTKNCKGR